MKLDESVGIGTLINHCGVSYVVVGEGAYQTAQDNYAHNTRLGLKVYKVSLLDEAKATDSYIIQSPEYISRNKEVDCFFPNAYEIPQYLKLSF